MEGGRVKNYNVGLARAIGKGETDAWRFLSGLWCLRKVFSSAGDWEFGDTYMLWMTGFRLDGCQQENVEYKKTLEGGQSEGTWVGGFEKTVDPSLS